MKKSGELQRPLCPAGFINNLIRNNCNKYHNSRIVFMEVNIDDFVRYKNS